MPVVCSPLVAAVEERTPKPLHRPLPRPLRNWFISVFQSAILLAALLWRMTSPSPTSRAAVAAMDTPLVRSNLLPPGARARLELLFNASDLRCWLELEVMAVVP